MTKIYQDELFCDNCDDDTLHTITIYDAQNRINNDHYLCNKCNYVKIGYNGEYFESCTEINTTIPKTKFNMWGFLKRMINLNNYSLLKIDS